MAKGTINIYNGIKAVPPFEDPPISLTIGKERKSRTIAFNKRSQVEYGIDNDRGYILKQQSIPIGESNVLLDFTGITTPGLLSIVCISGIVNVGFNTVAERPIILNGNLAPSCMFHVNSTASSLIYVGNLSAYMSAIEFILFERNSDFTQ